MTFFVTFCKKTSARTGNILFQYLCCKRISIDYGHVFIPIEEIHEDHDNKSIVLYEDDIKKLFEENIIPNNFFNSNIILDGYFQYGHYYTEKRDIILYTIYNSDDYWFSPNGTKQYIYDFLKKSHNIDFKDGDIVVSLRLDDFIQLPCPTSDIVSPTYYTDIIENRHIWRTCSLSNKIYIVCDTIHHDWEHKYIEFFKKWDFVLLQEDLLHDCSLMRDAPILIHSNSTLCWITSFFSNKPKIRFIPQTGFYKGQMLGKISDNDVVKKISPLLHNDVYNLNYEEWLRKELVPLPYCIPDELIIDFDVAIKKKHIIISDLLPGSQFSYRFGPNDENDYKNMYQESFFAITQKKGGWDCLRHYEIMANGCIPIFRELENCPDKTLVSFPKELIKDANRNLLPFYKDKRGLYDIYLKKMIEHIKTHCSASACIKYFMNHIQNPQLKNVLLIRGDIGVNYTRETFWIGMKRFIQEKGGVAIEYPKIDYLYDNYQGNNENLYGNGFTYSRKIKDDNINLNQDSVIEKIRSRFWDLIIYGKVGPDELYEGTIPNMPLWEHVTSNYGRNQIVFLYGGDECIDMTYNNRYSSHIKFHSKYAKCFIREFKG